MLAIAAPAGAQCGAAPVTVRQGCQATADLVAYMTPQLATAIAGGSSTLGQSGSLGGFGHFAVSIRGTGVLDGGFPEIGKAGFRQDGQPQAYSVKDQVIPGVGLDASFGLFNGLSLGATRIGGLDALVSALYMPNLGGDGDDFTVKATGGNVKLGYGVRVGILDETLVTPGVHVSYLERSLPGVTLAGTTGGGAGDTFALDDFTVKTTAWRVVAAKSFFVFGLQAGLGQDTYKGSAGIAVNVAGAQASGSAAMEMTRNNVFVGLSMNLLAFRLVGELGQVSGGTFPAPVNSFSKPADGSRVYGSVGLRLAY